MKTFENLQAEVEKLGEQTKDVSAKIDLKERYKGIETFDAQLVMDKLNTLATFHEKLSVTLQRYSDLDLHNSAKYWADNADGHYQAAKEVREAMTYLIRMQRLDNRIAYLKQTQ